MEWAARLPRSYRLPNIFGFLRRTEPSERAKQHRSCSALQSALSHSPEVSSHLVSCRSSCRGSHSSFRFNEFSTHLFSWQSSGSAERSRSAQSERQLSGG